MSKAPTTDVETALAALPEMRIEALRRYWVEALGGDPPPCQSGSFLRGLIAWRLQEAQVELAFLAPEITAAILRGAQPRHLTVDRLVRQPIPLSWKQQRVLFGLAA